MKPGLKKGIQLVLLITFLISTCLFGLAQKDKADGEAVYGEALSLATSGSTKTGEKTPGEKEEVSSGAEQWIPGEVTGDPVLEELRDMDLQALRSVNPDVVGWIRIPDTAIDYPIVQGQDNDFYLNHTWEGTENSVGSIFLEHRNAGDFTDFNTIVYGHNMNNGSMFADICRYVTLWYWERHPYVYVVTDAGAFRYEIFASYQATLDASAYGLSFQQSQTRGNFMLDALKSSVIDTDIEPELTDRILTLSTCSGAQDFRWVLQARLKMVKAEG